MSANSSLFDLTGAIKARLAESTSADPHKIADELLDNGVIPKKYYEDVLRVTLPQIVREHIRTQRRPRRRTGTDNFSQRWENGYRYWRIYTGVEWIWLDDCTREHLLEVADEYQRRADEQASTASEYRLLAGLFEKHKRAKTVADLPETEVREVMTDAAAVA